MSLGTDLTERVERAQLQQLIESLNLLPSQLRTALTDRLWTEIPTWIDEYASAPTQAAGTALFVTPQTSGLELIESVIVGLPTGATGIIQLGFQTMYVGAGVTHLSPVRKLLQTTDRRSIQTDTTGPVFIWLTGRQAPTYGVLAK